jgi:hypothetical protein
LRTGERKIRIEAVDHGVIAVAADEIAQFRSLVLRSALLRASRRTATGEIVRVAILRDGRAKSAASSG